MTPNPPVPTTITPPLRHAASRVSPPAWLRTVTIVVAVALFVGLGVSTVYRAGPHTLGGKPWGSRVHRTDFTVETAAGSAVLNGTDIYQAHNVRGWYYIYPPLFAIVMVPFALMSTFWAALAWYLLSVIFVAWAVKMCVPLVKTTLNFEGDPFVLYVLPLLLVMLPLMSALARGQATPALLWLFTAGLFYAWKGQDWRGGVCFAGGILLKVFPVVLLAYFVWRKRWRFVAATLAATAIGALVVPSAVYGWQGNIDYLKKWVSVIGKPALETESERADNPLYGQLLSSQLPRNQSLSAVLTRLTGNPNARWIGMAVGVIMAAAILLVGLRVSAGNEIYILSAAVVWMLLIPPVSWSHYFLLLLLPLPALVVTAITAPNKVVRQVAGGALMLFAVLSLGLGGSRAAQAYGPLCWGGLGIWGALLFAAARSPSPGGSGGFGLRVRSRS